MRLATIKLNGAEVAAIVSAAGVVPVEEVNKKLNQNWSTDMLEIITSGQLEKLNDWYRAGGKEKVEALEAIPREKAVFAPLYRRPRKIWGIGLNYVDHASDLAEKAPNEEPASFMKPDTAIIGHMDNIKIPLQSEKTTAESELGVIFGKQCKDVEREDWLSVVAGFTTIIDMTTEDILRKNPRFLTRSKSFDTFFSFGPELVTPDEVEDVMKLKVATVINGQIHAQNVVSNMTFPPDYLVSFHSKVMTMLPGDIISTGTPRAVHINDGDVVECWIDGFAPLKNPVIDLKKQK
ncbi:MAG: fumarylacetoacetate hydrolase family protein [Bacillota bacterium]|jgi:2-keto-4-pentenoate hydratase/2-oxohepta-3-ene-1,7-dioic acid hydratase in catechol pathway|uniref:Fumarylacetoacetate hydrolase n=1 Tax=Thermanaerosceptrum fracticalcis TaxID=1712410 RepID=A0A7G6E7K9_THEFR|nr:fumarylacetoacetate hydrolase family protein [Thermanaerosceptrum fracticalcis]MBZ4653563.1 fumarylacetoacetate hydrolase [Peptococcaceae bacterium]QNB48063.1 fumarylacetoacetate hydrolase [Thermanaerosceptrum fracticalcis]